MTCNNDFINFQAPVEAGKWNDVLDATTQPDACIQKNLFMYDSLNEFVGSEDCLYLNVYTPKVSKLM